MTALLVFALGLVLGLFVGLFAGGRWLTIGKAEDPPRGRSAKG